MLKLYHSLPASVRSLAATVRGFHLRQWRYGADTERLVREALERETWPPEKWMLWQEQQLALVLHRAATKVPYYREQWSSQRRRGDQRSWEYLENWQILEKDMLRKNPQAFVADDCDIKKM